MKRTRLKTTPFWERWDGCYQELWREVKKMPCVGLIWFSDHSCEGGHTSHHEPSVREGGNDERGQLPCCDAIHAPLENRSLRETRSEILARAKITEYQLRELALEYVSKARDRIQTSDLAF